MMIKTEKIRELDPMDRGFTLIAGPCSAESRQQVLECARSLSDMGVRIFRAGAWKPRTRPGNFEGWGEKALEWLREVKTETGMTVMTEVANSRHVEAALKAGIDMFWIGARTTTNPFAVQEIADSLRGVNIPLMVKNPINTELELWIGAFERLYGAGLTRLAAIHRGFSAHDERLYRYSPQWQIPVELRRRIPGLPILCDPSHMAGNSSLVPSLARKALDMKSDGLFIEVHPDPSNALSDSAQQLTPAQLRELLPTLMSHRDSAEEDMEILKPYRENIEQTDLKIVELVAERLKASDKLGDMKRLRNLTVLQPERYKALADDMVKEGKRYGLDEDFVRALFEILHTESIKHQLDNNLK
ncbi:MAG: bifunctional 3-deoxy-7-phosphoheptulonate synthase/chorismate mutase type II [Bacteroidaceae bacterium]|nr:bifunctional 3-deoxy-7-phosphoheptulonate synthase/chorismate mutase type II [Bacteroidaceae bacterium]MBO7588889.1 bifunctional 3-deoxy-7-phosphoheptulonate synthase/chorismate mutase type II [Bacteroidaceae bacterium]